MKALTLAAAAACCLALSLAPALAADPKLDAALKTATAISGDAAKLKTYCEMTAAMASADNENSTANSDEVNAKVDADIKALGPDFEALWSLGEQLDPASADGKALGDAMDALDAKCPK